MDKKRPPLAHVIYPDVLGAITDGGRVNGEHLQYALGIFPRRIYLNQPLELFVLLQSMIDSKMQVKVELKTPTHDRSGHLMLIDSAKMPHVLTLQPAETAILHIPLVAHPPTKAASRIPIMARVTPNVPRNAKIVRQPDGGPPPSVLALSPFRLQAFREVHFETRLNGDALKTTFDVEAHTLPASAAPLQLRFESLWAQEYMAMESKLAQGKVEEARRLAVSGAHGSAYEALRVAVGEKFAEHGLPLHPGEVRAITKMLCYTLEEAPSLEAGVNLDAQQWFKRLCQAMASDEDIGVSTALDEAVVKYAFEALVYDAVLLAFGMLRSHSKEDLGTPEEQTAYATRVFKWLAGQVQGDLTYVYLPLVLGGVLTDRMVALKRPDDPRELIEQLREAARGRQRLLSGEASVIFRILERLLLDAEQLLNRAGYRRY
ncbi:MAG: hypothetical protein HXY40_14965 [Chloroflexi bacterium]|nr:hypothetical protein [Chloroflexota bacterium]